MTYKGLLHGLYGLPLSVVKCCVTHYAGRHELDPSVNYCINNVPIASTTNCADLGILRQVDGLYKQHIAYVVTKTSRRVGTCRNANFMRQLVCYMYDPN